MSATNSTSYISFINNLNNQITNYYMIISSAIGLPTNIFSIWIFVRIMKKDKTNMSFLYLIQVIFDILVLVVQLVVLRSTPLIFSYSLFNLSDFSCKFLTFVRRYLNLTSTAITVYITIDRFVAVNYHNRFQGFMKKKLIILAIIFAMFVFGAVANIPAFLFYIPASGTGCTADQDVVLGIDVITILFRALIPMAIMTILSALIVRKMKISSRVKTQQSSHSRKETLFTISVIAHNVFFFVCGCPIIIYFIFKDVYMLLGYSKKFPALNAELNFYFGIALSASSLKQVFLFFMNFAFNKVFRNETLSLSSQNKNSSVVPSKTLSRTHEILKSMKILN